MRRRTAGRGRTLTARELVEAVRESGLTVRDRDALQQYLHELGGYTPLDWLCARVVVRRGRLPNPHYVWDDGRPGGNRV